MKKYATSMICLALSFACLVSRAGESLDDVIAKTLEARGGLENIRAVNTMTLSGKLVIPGGMELPISMKLKKPGKLRMDISFQGTTSTTAADGDSAWEINPMMGSSDAQDIDAKRARQLRKQADMEGPFVDTAKKGYKLELLGTEDIEGSKAYKIQATDKDGEINIYFIDADTYLEIQTTSKVVDQMGAEREINTFLSDYKEVGGVLVPHNMQLKSVDGQLDITIAFDTATSGEEIADEIFVKPAPTVVPEEKK